MTHLVKIDQTAIFIGKLGRFFHFLGQNVKKEP
jgi:hypothetical protein